MNVDTMSGARSATGEANAWALLNALPHPVILVEADDHIGEANIAAEAFFQASARSGTAACCTARAGAAITLPK